jgi:hypothetical protein
MLMANVIVLGELGDDEWLSQYGTIHHPIDGDPFKCRPTWGQVELSLIRGRRSVDEAAKSVNRKRSTGAFPGEGVRYVTAGRLREAGFRVWHSPTAFNPNHVSVATMDPDGVWTDDDKKRFVACFDALDESEWKEGRL